MKKFTLLFFTIVFLVSTSTLLFGQDFSDDFENGFDNWELTGDWGLTEDFSNSATHSMTDSPDGNYLPSLDTYCTMATGVDLSVSGLLSAEVSFWSIYDIENSIDFDYVKVQASDDDFETWADLGIFNGEGNLDPWLEYSYSLGLYIGSSDVKVRFHFHSDGGYEVDGIYIDDFEINSSDVDDAPPFISYENPPTFYEGTIEDYVITADLIDVSGIESSVVRYSVDGGDLLSLDGVFQVDDEYMFTIPAQEPGSLVEFYLEATDASANSNMATTEDYEYIAGHYWFYDDPEVAFYENVLSGGGRAVNFTLPNNVALVTGLIRNYQDGSTPPNKDFTFHVWGEGVDGPGDDLITPFDVSPAAMPSDPNPMTIVDLRDYQDELGDVSGDIYIGFTVDEDSVKFTIATLAAGRSYTYANDGPWGAAASDFHFRLVTGSFVDGISPVEDPALSTMVFPNPATDILYFVSSTSKIKSIKVVNVAGNIVYKQEVHDTKGQIQISNFNAGVYFVQVETENGITTKKIIVK